MQTVFQVFGYTYDRVDRDVFEHSWGLAASLEQAVAFIKERVARLDWNSGFHLEDNPAEDCGLIIRELKVGVFPGDSPEDEHADIAATYNWRGDRLESDPWVRCFQTVTGNN